MRQYPGIKGHLQDDSIPPALRRALLIVDTQLHEYGASIQRLKDGEKPVSYDATVAAPQTYLPVSLSISATGVNQTSLAGQGVGQWSITGTFTTDVPTSGQPDRTFYIKVTSGTRVFTALSQTITYPYSGPTLFNVSMTFSIREGDTPVLEGDNQCAGLSLPKGWTFTGDIIPL